MVEGHQCHRVGAEHRRRLLGRRFSCSSPNGKFTEGAARCNGRRLVHIEVHGKNLFYFFAAAAPEQPPRRKRRDGEPYRRLKPVPEPPPPAGAGAAVVVMRVHFGMSGKFMVHAVSAEGGRPEHTPTTRLEMKSLPEEQGGGSGPQLVCLLSAMTVTCGGEDLYQSEAGSLGPDPLREDADREAFFRVARASPHPIGLLLMEQSVIAGIGNIYRAEILFMAQVHPEQPASSLAEHQLECLWKLSVALLQRGFQEGSILTVVSEEVRGMTKRKERMMNKQLMRGKVPTADAVQPRNLPKSVDSVQARAAGWTLKP